MMVCDVCLKSGPTGSLVRLLQFDDVKEICDFCARKADRLLFKYREMAWVRCKRKLMRMHRDARATATPPRITHTPPRTFFHWLLAALARD